MQMILVLLLLASPPEWQPHYTDIPKLHPNPCKVACYHQYPDGDRPCPKGKKCKPGKLKTCLRKCKAAK